MRPRLDPRIDDYIATSAPFARPILKHLRKLVHQACPAATETMKWSMPHFEHAGAILCSFAAFKAHCAFGFWHKEMRALVAKEASAAQPAMGAFGRITSLEDLPADRTLVGYVRAAAKLNEKGEAGRPRRPRGPRRVTAESAVPAALAAAFKGNAAAAKTFAAFSPSQRKEYAEWIAEAKREETREKRLAIALEWLAAGKPRNWKYLKR